MGGPGLQIVPTLMPQRTPRSAHGEWASAPQAVLEAREIYALIAALPADFREALVAVDVLGLSYREAGRALRVREATITTRLNRARQRLARTLRGKESGAPDVMVGRGR
jgi:DNA-directed RNA polymerase specialized sigma24 family protein